MSEYEKLKSYATERGWTYEYGSGDHVKFYPPRELGKTGYVTVSINMTSNNRTFKNSISEFRKFDSTFWRRSDLGKPRKNKAVSQTETETAETPVITPSFNEPKETIMKPSDRTIYKQYAWLQIGTKVRVRNNESQSTPLVVTEIHSVDRKRVWEESDIVIVKGNGDKEHMAGDLDAWETRKCRICNEYRPINWFNLAAKSEAKKCTCSLCQKKESATTETPAPARTLKGQMVSEMLKTGDAEIIDAIDICCNEIPRMDKSQRLHVLSVFESADIYTAMCMRRMKTDISLFSDDEILNESFKRKLFGDMPSTASSVMDLPVEDRINFVKMTKELMSPLWSDHEDEDAIRRELVEHILQSLTDEELDTFSRKCMKAAENRITSDVPLSNLSDEELYTELKRRGWSGKLTRTQTLGDAE